MPSSLLARLGLFTLLLVGLAQVSQAQNTPRDVFEEPTTLQTDTLGFGEGGVIPPGAGDPGADGVEDGMDAHAGAHSDDEAHAGDHGEGHGDGHHSVPPIWLVIPFIAILLMIATGPLFYLNHWHHHYPKYAIGLGLVVAAYYVLQGDYLPIAHAAEEYFSFIALVASLFIAASGIFIRVNAKGTPMANVILLLIGSVVANFIATTGAAILFIRPFMRLNQGRLQAYHIVFFIFLVANVGGGLTPIGDPPLFLGFLRGVPFFWTLTHVFHIWLPAVVILLGIFFVIDSRNKDKSEAVVDPNQGTFAIEGKKNLIFVALIILSIFIDPNVFSWVPNLHALHIPFGIREIIMFGLAFGAYKFGDQESLRKNEFNFEPIREVGFLFLGIFITMQPALSLIGNFAANNAADLGVTLFYWATGFLSGFLDNAPTYLNFLAAAMGKFGLDANNVQDVLAFSAGVPDPTGGAIGSSLYLEAISVAAVFFGALTYIGNAPNFMVKAIAEVNGVETPSFGGYLIRYSLPILIPTYALIWLIFFSGYVF